MEIITMTTTTGRRFLQSTATALIAAKPHNRKQG
jgi:hypothetical protein